MFQEKLQLTLGAGARDNGSGLARARAVDIRSDIHARTWNRNLARLPFHVRTYVRGTVSRKLQLTFVCDNGVVEVSLLHV